MRERLVLNFEVESIDPTLSLFISDGFPVIMAFLSADVAVNKSLNHYIIAYRLQLQTYLIYLTYQTNHADRFVLIIKFFYDN